MLLDYASAIFFRYLVMVVELLPSILAIFRLDKPCSQRCLICSASVSPKTDKGRRTVALPPSAVLVLEEHRQKQTLDRAMLGKSLTENDLVFSDFEGKPLLPNTVTHAWIKLVRRIGLKNIRLHDTRHSHASLMLKQGIHPKVVQERLGHASIQVTLDLYSH